MPVKLFSLCCILSFVAAAPAQTLSSSSGAALASDPRVLRAMNWLTTNVPWITEEQVRITEIPAPPFKEAARGSYLKRLLSSAGLRVSTDSVGNIIGLRPGLSSSEVVLVVAHLDTVFPAGTDVRVRRAGARQIAPGITDNGAGLAALVALARAMQDARIKTRQTILFVADVGEEGEGNLRGMRRLIETYRQRLRTVIAVDGSGTDFVTNAALASRRFEVSFTGPGGHSWTDFGMPNPINAAGRAIARFITLRVPDSPRTIFNVGEISGGTSVNSIPYRASFKVDMRSEQESEIDKIEAALRAAVQSALEEENAASRRNSVNAKLDVKIQTIGVRPGGELPEDSALLAVVRQADRIVGNRSRLERSSTDANIPLSLGIPAIAIGAGGRSGGAHSLDEWYDPTGRELGLHRALLILLGAAGLEPSP